MLQKCFLTLSHLDGSMSDSNIESKYNIVFVKY